MKLLTKLLATTLFSSLMLTTALAQTAGSDSLGDSLYSFMGNGGYDALDYTIDLRFSPDKTTLVGTTTMEATATQDLSSFNLDFGSMTVSNVVVNGAAARFAQADPEMTISPSTTLKKGEKFKVSIVYSGKPGTKLGAAANFGQWLLSPAGLTVLAEPSLMFTWSPVNEHPSDKATFSLKLTSDKKDTAVANGEFISRTENTDGTASSSYRIATPTSTYFVVMVVGNWKLEEEPKAGNVRIRHYFAPGTSDVMRKAIAETGNIITFYSKLLTPYPFTEAGAVTSDNDLGFALETQSLISMPTSFGQGEDLIFTTEVVAHEYAHQWFGALVTFKNHEDMFMHEGFAEYLGTVYTASRFANQVGKTYLDDNFENFYPTAVNGRFVSVRTRAELVAGLRSNRFGSKKLNATEISQALDSMFNGTLPVTAREKIVAKVPSSGLSFVQLADEINALEFTRVIISSKTQLQLIALSGARVPSRPENWDVVTPPGKVKAGDDPFNAGVYQRGAMTLHALRAKIGEDAFWKLLRDFLEKNKFSNVSNKDWLDFVEANVGKEARTLQERWLFDNVAPDFPELGLKAADFKLGADFK